MFILAAPNVSSNRHRLCNRSLDGIPQMAADREAISLLRGVTCLYEIFIYSVLERINITSMHTIS